MKLVLSLSLCTSQSVGVWVYECAFAWMNEWMNVSARHGIEWMYKTSCAYIMYVFFFGFRFEWTVKVFRTIYVTWFCDGARMPMYICMQNDPRRK